MNNLHLAAVIPVFNDWTSVSDIIIDLDLHLSELDSIENVVVFVVDDGSTTDECIQLNLKPNLLSRIEVIRLGCNLGHQRAIAIGLSEVVSRTCFDAILVMDSDGEDNPTDAKRLYAKWHNNPNSVVVARRKDRHEGPLFQVFYKIYLNLFRLLSGRSLEFGNFAILSAASAIRLVHMPELWNHFAASILRSRLPLIPVFINKGKRRHGLSQMNFVSLVNHGLSAASVMIDIVFVRLLIVSTAAAFILIGAASYVLYQKLFTSYAIPGWASNMIGLSLIGLFQLLALIFVTFFLVLSNRSNLQMPTLCQSREYVESISVTHL